jgi:hypothetical protein
MSHRRAQCIERCPLGSEEGCAEKARHTRRDLAAQPILSNMRSRRLYRAEGYEDHGGILFLPGACMYPMLRQPCPVRRGGQPLARCS